MFDYFHGKIVEKNPAYVVIDCHGVGYLLNISINTFDKIPDPQPQSGGQGKDCKLFAHQAIREDAHVLYGFAEQEERMMFRDLISVSGVGAATARVMLSSMAPNDIQNAIINGDVSRLKAIKGIGEKTAQRIIVDLKSKVGKENFGTTPIIGSTHNKLRSEALNALETLGYARNAAEKAIDKVIREDTSQPPNGGERGISLEELVKRVLKNF